MMNTDIIFGNTKTDKSHRCTW